MNKGRLPLCSSELKMSSQFSVKRLAVSSGRTTG
eukprot:CAMPEP_0197650014 /NCGR_PEP_ID=MMETSP1338-20131121/30695_1 /TAXON_ID=43686 ORGANISM="Pelagodinium beii, Strain RCC1491" /NCGR_SAMPLE_ID=MMETSP1338 /ASSEMBLY_ACC=CAM_ASM_000754 /LENGTH=33 /DNA_ID= /DNA_START= /DNA_END= /DNA_ORIENTATION=